MAGFSIHFREAVKFYESITGKRFDWSTLSKKWREYFEGVVLVDNAIGDKKGVLSNHWRLISYRVNGWSPPDLETAYRELCTEIGEEDKMRGYGAFSHLHLDNQFLGGDLPKEWPRIRDEGTDVVFVQGEAIETKVFKKEVLYPAYAEHYRMYQPDMEELLGQMPDEFKPFSRFKGTKPGWKKKVRNYANKYSKLYPDGPLAFTPEELEGFASNAVGDFISRYPNIVAEMQLLTV